MANCNQTSGGKRSTTSGTSIPGITPKETGVKIGIKPVTKGSDTANRNKKS